MGDVASLTGNRSEIELFASELLRDANAGAADPAGSAAFRFFRLARAVLALQEFDAALVERFHLLFADCEESSPSRIDLQCGGVRRTRSIRIDFQHPAERLDLAEFSTTLFAGHAYECLGKAGEWSVIGAGSHPIAITRSNTFIVDEKAQWQPLIANMIVNLTLASQTDMLFCHAATARVGDRGIVIAGKKGAGKSTLVTALGARGHAVLGDEFAAIDPAAPAVVSIPRSVSLREGPRSRILDRFLEGKTVDAETYPDGSVRSRIRISELFGRSPCSTAELSDVVFLDGFADTPELTHCLPTLAHAALLEPLGCSFVGDGRASKLFATIALLSRIRCWNLRIGDPDATAQLLESNMRNR